MSEEKVGKKRKRVFKTRCIMFTHNGGTGGWMSDTSLEDSTNQRLDEQKWMVQFTEYCKTKNVTRCRVQWEKGEGTDRLHLQGYIEFGNPVSIMQFIKDQPGLHAEAVKDKTAAIVYVFKKETAVSLDDCPTPNLEIGVFKRSLIDPLAGFTLHNWQTVLERELNTTIPDDRSIVWYVDDDGNSGKTTFAKHYMICHPHTACYLSVGAGKDLAHCICAYQDNDLNDLRVLILDVPRCTEKQYVSYATIEKIKDGMLFSPKYESSFLMFNPPHVIVFSNDMPERQKMSQDRWVIRHMSRAEGEETTVMPERHRTKRSIGIDGPKDPKPYVFKSLDEILKEQEVETDREFSSWVNHD